MLNFDKGNHSVESLINKASQMTVGDILTKNARTKPEKIAIEFEGRRWTHVQLNQEVNKLANSLVKIGIARSDRLAILSENRIEYCVTLYAAAKLGVIVPALNWRFSESELKESILLTKPETILVSGEHFPRLRSVLENQSFLTFSP